MNKPKKVEEKLDAYDYIMSRFYGIKQHYDENTRISYKVKKQVKGKTR